MEDNFTHTYTNLKGGIVRCRIEGKHSYKKGWVTVINENGCSVYLEKNKLKKIKNKSTFKLKIEVGENLGCLLEVIAICLLVYFLTK